MRQLCDNLETILRQLGDNLETTWRRLGDSFGTTLRVHSLSQWGTWEASRMPELPEPLSDPGCVLVDNPVTNQREILVTGYYDDFDDHDNGDDDDRRSRLCPC